MDVSLATDRTFHFAQKAKEKQSNDPDSYTGLLINITLIFLIWLRVFIHWLPIVSYSVWIYANVTCIIIINVPDAMLSEQISVCDLDAA